MNKYIIKQCSSGKWMTTLPNRSNPPCRVFDTHRDAETFRKFLEKHSIDMLKLEPMLGTMTTTDTRQLNGD